MERPTWDDYFMQQCDLVATRSTCDRKNVGAVIVKDKRIICAGYNGSLPGLEHCLEVGHDMENSHCVRTVHAEVNSIADAARRGVSVAGATMYCNTMPCWNCFKTIVSAGITEIVYRDEYRADLKDKVLETAAMIPGFVMRRLAAAGETAAVKPSKPVRVKHTGSRAEKVGAAEVAKALGAERVDVYPQLPRRVPRKKKTG